MSLSMMSATAVVLLAVGIALAVGLLIWLVVRPGRRATPRGDAGPMRRAMNDKGSDYLNAIDAQHAAKRGGRF